mmetsp:Transcript_47840/g.121347  ORF Transcript_47840/g.121347 Transcript_47840/m.121347 type:complete len:304 (-) Transcript_47840:1279-2190(-)
MAEELVQFLSCGFECQVSDTQPLSLQRAFALLSCLISGLIVSRAALRNLQLQRFSIHDKALPSLQGFHGAGRRVELDEAVAHGLGLLLAALRLCALRRLLLHDAGNTEPSAAAECRFEGGVGGGEAQILDEERAAPALVAILVVWQIVFILSAAFWLCAGSAAHSAAFRLLRPSTFISEHVRRGPFQIQGHMPVARKCNLRKGALCTRLIRILDDGHSTGGRQRASDHLAIACKSFSQLLRTRASWQMLHDEGVFSPLSFANIHCFGLVQARARLLESINADALFLQPPLRLLDDGGLCQRSC